MNKYCVFTAQADKFTVEADSFRGGFGYDQPLQFLKDGEVVGLFNPEQVVGIVVLSYGPPKE